ncbi:MAG: monovalent cation/H+ antiporter subunit D family protein [bacterium]
MNLIPLFVAIPLFGAFLLPLAGKSNKIIERAISLAVSLFLVIASIYSLFLVQGSQALVYKFGNWIPPIGICFVLDGLSAFMLITVNIVAFTAMLYSVNYIEKFSASWKYFTLYLLMTAGLNGVVLTGDLFNLFVFMELTAVACYALVAFGCEHEELEAAFKYMVLGTIASLFILIGIVFIYSYTSSLNMADISRELALKQSVHLNLLVMVLFIMGFGLKAALVPFHSWLPDAHPSAPAPVSAMLSGVVIKALGVYVLVRLIFNVLGNIDQTKEILMMLGALSMVVGVILAVVQWDFKRLLAYHSISQIGYVVLGFGLATPLGILGGLFHLINHAAFKSLLFLNAGAVEYNTNTRQLEEMGGLKQVMPVTSSTSLVASMSIAGVPPFNGFWSKLIIIIAAVEAQRYVYASIAVIVSIITLISFAKVQRYCFYGALKEKWEKVKEVPVFMASAMIILAVLCVIMGGMLIPSVKGIVFDPAIAVISQGIGYGNAVLGSLK